MCRRRESKAIESKGARKRTREGKMHGMSMFEEAAAAEGVIVGEAVAEAEAKEEEEECKSCRMRAGLAWC